MFQSHSNLKMFARKMKFCSSSGNTEKEPKGKERMDTFTVIGKLVDKIGRHMPLHTDGYRSVLTLVTWILMVFLLLFQFKKKLLRRLMLLRMSSEVEDSVQFTLESGKRMEDQ